MPLSPKAKKLKEALEHETGLMVSFRNREVYLASQRRLQAAARARKIKRTKHNTTNTSTGEKT
jgi:hypothetical protein